MENKDLSFTVWARSTIESDIFVYKPAEWFKIWFFLISKAFWHDGKMLKRGECLLTLAEISAATKTTRDQVDKALRWLRTSRMIDAEKTTRGLRIFIVNYAKYQDSAMRIKRQGSDREATGKRQGSDTIEEPIKKGTNKPINQGTIHTMVAGDAGFARFWSVYPRKVAKPKALQSWKRLKPTPDLVDRIVSHVEASKLGSQWSRDGGQYIPHPTTYLNQERWEEVLDHQRPNILDLGPLPE